MFKTILLLRMKITQYTSGASVAYVTCGSTTCCMSDNEEAPLLVMAACCSNYEQILWQGNFNLMDCFHIVVSTVVSWATLGCWESLLNSAHLTFINFNLFVCCVGIPTHGDIICRGNYKWLWHTSRTWNHSSDSSHYNESTLLLAEQTSFVIVVSAAIFFCMLWE